MPKLSFSDLFWSRSSISQREFRMKTVIFYILFYSVKSVTEVFENLFTKFLPNMFSSCHIIPRLKGAWYAFSNRSSLT